MNSPTINYLTYLHLMETFEKDIKYIYHYTPKDNYKFIKKYGLMSLYALHQNLPDKYKEAIEHYRERMRNYSKKENFTIDDVSKFFESEGLSSKSIFFSFWEIIPGLSAKRDSFISNSIKVMIDIKNLKNNWKYTLVNRAKTSSLKKSSISEYTKMNSYKFQKMSAGKFLFTKIPHLSIHNNEGIISKDILIMS